MSDITKNLWSEQHSWAITCSAKKWFLEEHFK